MHEIYVGYDMLLWYKQRTRKVRNAVMCFSCLDLLLPGIIPCHRKGARAYLACCSSDEVVVDIKSLQEVLQGHVVSA